MKPKILMEPTHLALHGKQGQQSASEVIETYSTRCALISRCYQSPTKGGL